MTAVDVLDSTVMEVAPVHSVQFTTRCAADPVAINAAMRQAFAMVMPFIARSKLAQTGPPRAIYSEFNANETCFTLAIPVAAESDGSVEAPPEGVIVSLLPGGRMRRFTHRGAYSDLGQTYEAITMWLQKEGLIKDASEWTCYSPMWEEYATDPASTTESELVTYIYLPER